MPASRTRPRPQPRAAKERYSHSATEPPAALHGGYIPIRSIELAMAWGLLLNKELRPIDVRVWLAVRELQERRRHVGKGRAPKYTLEEVRHLVGGGGGTLCSSLRRLRASRLLVWSEGGPRVATSPDELVTANLEAVWAFYRALPAKRKRIPVPRRILRLLAGGVKRSVLATALGQLTCCLFFHRREGWNPQGSCKGSWIATTFGLSERSVIRARQHLEELGWLRRIESPSQWHLNRYGATYRIELGWARTAAELSTTLERRKLQTSSPRSGCHPTESLDGTKLSGPESEQTLSSRLKNQKPASGGPTGDSQGEGMGEKVRPNLRDIKREDLGNVPRLMELFDQALERGLVQEGFLDRLNFAAAAEHARVRGSSNPCGLFFHLVSKKLWHYITEGDEDAVRANVRAYVYNEPEESRSARRAAPKRRAKRVQDLSGDAFALRTVRVRLQIRTSVLMPAPSLEREFRRAGWSTARYQAAVEELGRYCSMDEEAPIDGAVGSYL